jgi:serine/threonine protein kinase
MLAINQILQGRYRIIRQLGRGGMGAVYEAEDMKRFGSSVALKEILLDFARISDIRQQEMVRRAFEREAKILTQLEDDAFPKVIEYFLETDRQFLVMELIKGDDLAELLEKRQCAFPLEDVLKWADQLLDALDYLHTLNPPIVHRDIKPHNLKLNSRRKIKLLDFGIAKDTGAELSSTIANDTFIGATLNYSPLEQLLRVPLYCEPLKSIYGEKVGQTILHTAEARSDIYSLGATLYHLLTNVLPLDAYNRALKIWAMQPDPLPSPHELNSSIPPEISDVLVKSMDVECEHRFATAGEMKAALNEAIFKERQREEIGEREKWLAEQGKTDGARETFGEHQANPNLSSDDATFPNISDYKTEPFIGLPPVITQPLRDESPAAEDWHTDASSTQSTENELSTSATAASFLDELNTEPEKEITPEPVKEKEPVPSDDTNKSKKNPVLILLVSVIALLMLGIGVLGFFLINKRNSASGNQTPATNKTVMPTNSPPESPSVTPTVEAVDSPMPTPSPMENIYATPTPKVAPTSAPTVENSNPATPTPKIVATPVPTRTKTPPPATPQKTPVQETPNPVSVCKTKDEKTGLFQIIPCSQCKFVKNCIKVQ